MTRNKGSRSATGDKGTGPDTGAILLDQMAYQRTFDGAYMRTALGELSYALIVLRLFQQSFYYVGLVNVLLAAGIALAAVYRSRLGIENVERMAGKTKSTSRRYSTLGLARGRDAASALPITARIRARASSVADWLSPRSSHFSLDRGEHQQDRTAEDVGMSDEEEQQRCVLHGVSHFKTAGNVVVLLTVTTFCLQAAILGIVLDL